MPTQFETIYVEITDFIGLTEGLTFLAAFKD